MTKTAPRKPQEPAHGPISAALVSALGEALTSPQDAATVALATRYARDLDLGAVDLEKGGPQLLAVLAALRMTPQARQAVVKGGEPSDGRGSALAEIRRRRQSRPASVDAPAS